MDRGAFIAGVGSGMLEARLNDIAHNLANVSTPGYKASRTAFAAVLARGLAPRGDKAAYPSLAGQRFDLRPGELRATGRALDVAIVGEGFFRVRLPDGSVGITRNGEWKLDGTRTLVTSSGFPVLDEQNRPIVLPQGEFVVDQDGRVFVDGVQVAVLGLSAVRDPAVLEKRSGGVFAAPPAALAPAPDTVRVRQGMLEGANVQAVLEMTRIVTLSRHHEMQMRLIDRFAEVERLLAERVGRVDI